MCVCVCVCVSHIIIFLYKKKESYLFLLENLKRKINKNLCILIISSLHLLVLNNSPHQKFSYFTHSLFFCFV